MKYEFKPKNIIFHDSEGSYGEGIDLISLCDGVFLDVDNNYGIQIYFGGSKERLAFDFYNVEDIKRLRSIFMQAEVRLENADWIEKEKKRLIKCGVPESIAEKSLEEICISCEKDGFKKQLYADILQISNSELDWDDELISLRLQHMEKYSGIEIDELSYMVSKITVELTEVNTGEKTYFEFEP